MEKILLAVDATKRDTQSLDFACYLAGLTNSSITGIFLENPAGSNMPMGRALVYDNSSSGLKPDANADDFITKKETVNSNVLFFKQACERRSTKYSVRRDSGDPIIEIIRESRYADLLVLDAETSFKTKFEGTPTAFVKDILKDVECPTVIAPDSFEGIEEIVFSYDGSKSSMFAIKQFCYLFPQLEDKKVILLQVNEEDPGSADERRRLKEWLGSHYSSVGFTTLTGNAETELLASLLKRQNAFIIMGAYGRNIVSQFFRQSHADVLIKTLNQAIFIAHY